MKILNEIKDHLTKSEQLQSQLSSLLSDVEFLVTFHSHHNPLSVSVYGLCGSLSCTIVENQLVPEHEQGATPELLDAIDYVNNKVNQL